MISTSVGTTNSVVVYSFGPFCTACRWDRPDVLSRCGRDDVSHTVLLGIYFSEKQVQVSELVFIGMGVSRPLQ